MSKVKSCDICGEFYAVEEEVYDRKVHQPGTVRLTLIDPVLGNYKMDKKDLCPTCCRVFHKLLKIDKEHENIFNKMNNIIMNASEYID